jgi:hypothetical protein
MESGTSGKGIGQWSGERSSYMNEAWRLTLGVGYYCGLEEEAACDADRSVVNIRRFKGALTVWRFDFSFPLFGRIVVFSQGLNGCDMKR